jgi:hypothetical protein
LFAGLVGFVIAIIIATIIRFTGRASPIILWFWPTAIVGLADPTSGLDKMLTAVVMFGGNFLLYGAVGAVAGVAADRLHRKSDLR